MTECNTSAECKFVGSRSMDVAFGRPIQGRLILVEDDAGVVVH